MSLVGKRDEIAAVLSTVDGVKGYAKRPDAPRPGDAWPQWGGSERDENTPAFMETWQVLVHLPADYARADAWVDSHRDALWDAVESVGWILAFEPAELGQTGGGAPINGLMITMRSE